MLKALDTQYVAIHGPNSREYYRDMVRPERIASALPEVYHQEDDTIYALPPRSLAFLVSANELPGAEPDRNAQALERYVAAREDSSRPALRTSWRDYDTLEIDGAVDGGRLIAVSMNADPGWHAWQDGREIPIVPDTLGFAVLHPTDAAAAHIEMRYRVGAEPRIMAAISALAWVGAMTGLFLWRKRSASTTTN
jgi:hypothetical protein